MQTPNAKGDGVNRSTITQLTKHDIHQLAGPVRHQQADQGAPHGREHCFHAVGIGADLDVFDRGGGSAGSAWGCGRMCVSKRVWRGQGQGAALAVQGCANRKCRQRVASAGSGPLRRSPGLQTTRAAAASTAAASQRGDIAIA